MDRRNVMGIIAGAATLALSQMSFGQLALTGNSYTQNFDSIGSGLPAGFTGRTGATATSLGSTSTFVTSPTAYTSTTGAFINVASYDIPGTSTTAVQAADTNRAFALQPTAAFGDPGGAFTVQLSNTAGLSNFSLSFAAAVFHNQGRTSTYTVQYGLGSTPTSFTDLTTFTSDSLPNDGSFQTGASTISIGSAALAGIANQTGNVFLRIVELAASTGSGSRDMVGIDNFSLSYSGTPVVTTPRNLVYNSGNFDAANSFLDGATPATFDSSRPDNAIFSQAGAPSSVTIGSAVTTGYLDFEASAPVTTLTGGTLTINTAGTFNQSAVLNTNITLGGAQTWTIASGKSVTLNSPLQGSALTLSGAGSVAMNAAAASFTGGISIGSLTTVYLNAVTAGNAADGTLATPYSPLGSGPTTVNGGTLVINNVAVGLSVSSLTTSQITLANGATLVGVGSAQYNRASAALTIVNGASAAAPNSVTILTPTVNDSLTMQNSLRQSTAGTASFATIHKAGSGKLILTSGGTTSTSGFAGNWSLDAGTVQLGPYDPAGFGVPINGFGQTYTNPIPVAVNGAALVITTNVINANNTTAGQPTTLRNPLTLGGGTLEGASIIASEFDENLGAEFSGDMTTTPSTTTTIQTNDAYAAGSHIVNFVTDTPTGNFNFGANSTLSVLGGGTFIINRSTGTSTVASGASISVGSLSTFTLAGSTDPLGDSAGAAFVGVANAGTFNVTTGTKNVGLIAGAGKTTVSDGVSVTTEGVRQSALALNGAAITTIRAGATANTASKTSIVGSLSLGGGSSPTAKLNLTNNSLVIDYAPGAAGTILSDTRAQIIAGLGGNVGITSSALVNAGMVGATALGYGDTATLGAGTYSGVAVDSSAVVVKYTYSGDANLDGKVNIGDLGALATSFGLAGNWSNGDFNYDGTVGIGDLGLLATNFGLGSTTPLTLNFQQALALVESQTGVQLPEPSATLLIGGSLLGLARRKRVTAKA